VRHRSRPLAALIALGAAPLLTGAALPSAHVTVTVDDMRSAKGQVLACLTARPDSFPDCSSDPHAITRKVPASATTQLDFGQVPDGRYAIALIHDENNNGKLDKRLMIPREGFGFSRDAPVRMGPPRFDKAAFAVEGVSEHLTIRMRYML